MKEKLIQPAVTKAWRKNIRKVEPYIPGEQPKLSRMIKLNTNENPYPPSPYVERAIGEFENDRLRRYPDPASSVLVDALADYYGLKGEQVFVGVGSDDVLATAFLAFFNSDKPILFPDITYSFYDVWAKLYRIPYERPALDENFRLRREDYYKENGGIILANPNAPTSIFEPLSVIEDIIAHNPEVVVIIDEAYVDFGGESARKLIDLYDNLLVVQTFSKSRSMAGMRIGYAMGNEELIKALNDVKYSINSYTMNQTSLYFGVEAVRDEVYFKECIGKITATRERVKKELRELGFSFPDSKANFIFACHNRVGAKEIFEALRQQSIFVRYFDKTRLDNYLRITIGTDSEMDTMICYLRSYLSEK